MSQHIKTSPHYPALDGLRGMAVLLVMLHHFVRSYDTNSVTHNFLLQSTEFMWCGVDLFFVLSGFLITGILLETRDRPHYFRNFYGRRILRIFPLYYGILFLAFVILPIFHIDPSSATRQCTIYFLTFTSNVRFAFFGWSFHALDAYWSLALEEQFYLLWPLLLLVMPRKLHFPFVVLGLVSGIVFRAYCIHAGMTSLFLYTMLPTRADGLLVGALLAMMVTYRSELPKLGYWTTVITSILIAAFFFLGSFRLLGLKLYYDAWNARGAMFYYPTIAACFGTLLYFCIIQRNPIQNFFKNSFLRMAGKYSYCLYLIHQPITHVFHGAIRGTMAERYLESGVPLIQDLIQIVPLFLISFGCAALSWRFLERPMLRLKRYFSEEPPPVTISAAISV